MRGKKPSFSVLNLASIRFLLLTTFAVGIPLANAADFAKEIAAPCAPGESEEAIRESRKKGHVGQRACKVMLPSVKTAIEAQIRKYSDQYYKGCNYDPTQPLPADGSCQGSALQGKVCNMLVQPGVPSTFNNGIKEWDTNHLGGSCGEFTFFKTRLSGRTCNVTPIQDGVYHERERAFVRGAYIQALNCKHQVVQNEVTQGKLKLTFLASDKLTGAVVSGPCATIAQDYLDTSKKNGKYLQEQMAERVNIEDIDNCSGGESTNVKELNPDVGRRRQSACQLASMRANLETMWAHLAACEIFYRSQLSHEKFMGLTATQSQIDSDIRGLLNSNRCGSKKPSDCNNLPIRNNCYLPRYKAEFERRANEVWNAESCR